jgi:hypothetical protein
MLGGTAESWHAAPPNNIGQLFLTAKQILVPSSLSHYFIIVMFEDDKNTHEAQRGPRL